MKTVQEHLKEAEREKLIDYYIYKHSLKLEDVTDDDVTAGQLKDWTRIALKKYMDRLCNLEIKPSEDGRAYVFVAHKVYGDYEDTSISLVCLEELMEIGLEANSYSYTWDYQETTMGYYVADTPYTQKNMLDLLVEVLYEACFWGFEQEGLEQARSELDEAIAEMENGEIESYTAEEVFARFGIEPRNEDETEVELRKALITAQNRYNGYLYKKELQALLDVLRPEKH